LSVSSVTSFPNSAGGIGTGSPPSSARRLAALGRPMLNSPLD